MSCKVYEILEKIKQLFKAYSTNFPIILLLFSALDEGWICIIPKINSS